MPGRRKSVESKTEQEEEDRQGDPHLVGFSHLQQETRHREKGSSIFHVCSHVKRRKNYTHTYIRIYIYIYIYIYIKMLPYIQIYKLQTFRDTCMDIRK